HEKKRTKRILTDLAIDQATFDDHVALLQFADNISLYVCLNEPGVSQSNVHFFFKDGIPIALNSALITHSKIQAEWLDNQTLKLSGLTFVPKYCTSRRQKVHSKQMTEETRIINEYETQPYEQININSELS